MNKSELLENIKRLIKNIGSKRHQHDTGPYRLKSQGEEIIKNLEQLFSLLGDDNNQKSIRDTITMAIGRLRHTMGKEVKFADYSYKKTLKNNAAKIRTDEYETDFSNAVQQMHFDLISIESMEF